MNLIRKYKISKINNTLIAGREGEIIEFITSILSNLDLYTYYKYPENTFLMSPKGEWIIEIVPEFDTAYIRYENFWLYLRRKYNVNMSDIQPFIIYLLSTKYNIKIGFTDSFDETDYTDIENFYKKERIF